MILKQGHKYEPMPHDGKTIWRIYRGGRCYYKYSPYSLAATQALKAAFPAYWTAILDYGWANPALVPFINEDPMLIVSLVEVGKTRWLVTDGLARFTIPYKPNQDSHITAIYQVESLAANLGNGVSIFGSAQAWRNNGFETLLPVNNETTCYFVYGSNPFQFSMKTPFNKTLKIDANGVNWVWENVEDNVTLQSHTFSSVTFSSPNDLGVFMNYRGAFDTLVYPIIKISSVTVDNVHSLLPFTRNGENGMLDILSRTFHPNANTEGAFTIQITDKA